MDINDIDFQKMRFQRDISQLDSYEYYHQFELLSLTFCSMIIRKIFFKIMIIYIRNQKYEKKYMA